MLNPIDLNTFNIVSLCVLAQALAFYACDQQSR